MRKTKKAPASIISVFGEVPPLAWGVLLALDGRSVYLLLGGRSTITQGNTQIEIHCAALLVREWLGAVGLHS